MVYVEEGVKVVFGVSGYVEEMFEGLLSSLYKVSSCEFVRSIRGMSLLRPVSQAMLKRE